MQHTKCTCLGERGCMSREVIQDLLQDEAIEQAIERLVAKLPRPRVQSASVKRHRTPRAQPVATEYGGPIRAGQRPKTAPSALDSSLHAQGLRSNHVRNVQQMSRRPQSQGRELDDSLPGQAMMRAECVSISRHYVDKFPWQSKMCLRAMTNLRKHRQRKQRDLCAERLNKMHDLMEHRLQLFIETQIATLAAWRATEFQEWSKVLAAIKEQTRGFANDQAELRVSHEQAQAKSAEKRYLTTLAKVDEWESEDCRVVVYQTSQLEVGESADVRALNQAMMHARWALEYQKRQGELQRRRFQEANHQWLCCIADDAVLVQSAQGCYQEAEAKLQEYQQYRVAMCQRMIDTQLHNLHQIMQTVERLGAQTHQQYLQAMNVEKIVSRSFEATMQQMFDTRIHLAVSDSDRSELTWGACENANFARRELRQLGSALWSVVDILANRRAAWQRKLHQFKHEHIDGIGRYLEDLKGLLGKKKHEIHRHIQTLVQGMCERRKEALHGALSANQHRNFEDDQNIANFSGVLSRIPSSFITVWQQITLGLEVLQQPIQDERSRHERQLVETMESDQLKLCAQVAVRQIENMQMITAHKATVERVIQDFADQKTLQWLAQRIEPMMDLLPVYETMAQDVAQLLGSGFPQLSAFQFIDNAEQRYQDVFPALQRAAIEQLEQWSMNGLASQHELFSSTLRARYKTELNNLAQECIDLRQRVLASGNEWLTKHDQTVVADVAGFNEAVLNVERGLQQHAQEVETKLAGTVSQATTKLNRFWRESKVVIAEAQAAIDRGSLREEPFKRLHMLLLEQMALHREPQIQLYIFEVLQGMKSHCNNSHSDETSERFKLAWFFFAVARIVLVQESLDAMPTVDTAASLSRIQEDNELIAASSEWFALAADDAMVELAAEEANFIGGIHHPPVEVPDVTAMASGDVQPVRTCAELSEAVTAAGMQGQRQMQGHATALLDDSVDEKIRFCFSDLTALGKVGAAVLSRVLLTWRMCANAMLHLVSSEECKDTIQVTISEHMVQRQNLLGSTTPAAAVWIVRALTAMPSVPLSRLQATLVLSLALDGSPLMPLDHAAVDHKKLAAGLTSWCRAAVDMCKCSPRAANQACIDFWQECEPVGQCLDHFPIAVAPVSCISMALSYCANQQSWQGTLRALCLWRLIEHCTADASSNDNNDNAKLFACVPDWSRVNDQQQFDVAAYMQLFRQALRGTVRHVSPGETLVDPQRTLWYAKPFVNLQQLRALLGSREDALAKSVAQEFELMCKWLHRYEEVRSGTAAPSFSAAELAARRQFRLSYVLDTIERNSVARWYSFVSKLHHKRAAKEMSENSDRIRLYEASAENFLDVVCQNRESMIRQVTEAAASVEHYQAQAKTTIASLETNAIRLSDYYLARCRVCMANCFHATKSAYDKLHAVWVWQMGRADKLATDFTSRLQDVMKKAEAVDSARLSAIAEEASPQLRELAYSIQQTQQADAQASFASSVERAVAEIQLAINSQSSSSSLEEAIQQASVQASSWHAELKNISEEMWSAQERAEAAAAALALEQGPEDTEESIASRQRDIEAQIHRVGDANSARWLELLERLRQEFTQQPQNLGVAAETDIAAIRSCFPHIERSMQELEDWAYWTVYPDPSMVQQSYHPDQLAIIEQVLRSLQSEYSQTRAALRGVEQSVTDDFQRRLENLEYQLSVKQDNMGLWLRESCHQIVAVLESDILLGSLSVAYQQKHHGYGYADDALLAGVQCIEAHFHAFQNFVRAWLQELQTTVSKQFTLQLGLVEHWKTHIGTGRVAGSQDVLKSLADQLVEETAYISSVEQLLQQCCVVEVTNDRAENEKLYEQLVSLVRNHKTTFEEQVMQREQSLQQRVEAAKAELQPPLDALVEIVQQHRVNCENWRVDALTRVLGTRKEEIEATQD